MFFLFKQKHFFNYFNSDTYLSKYFHLKSLSKETSTTMNLQTSLFTLYCTHTDYNYLLETILYFLLIITLKICFMYLCNVGAPNKFLQATIILFASYLLLCYWIVIWIHSLKKPVIIEWNEFPRFCYIRIWFLFRRINLCIYVYFIETYFWMCCRDEVQYVEWSMIHTPKNEVIVPHDTLTAIPRIKRLMDIKRCLIEKKPEQSHSSIRLRSWTILKWHKKEDM